MILRPTKNITRQYWDIISMPDTVIDQVNLIGNINKRYWNLPIARTDSTETVMSRSKEWMGVGMKSRSN